MTEANLNATVEGYRGAIGKLVFRNYKGRTIVSRKPVVTKEPTQGQLAHRERFKDAVAFAKSAMASPALRAFYEPIAKARDITVYALAVADYLKTPEFKYVELENYKGRVGDTIMIKVVDDIGMANVDVSLSAQDGTPIESGPAVEQGTGSGKWIYIATVPVALGTDIFIEARGADHASNKTVISANPIVGQDEE
jgi:hypothetical protein